jgi:hypothetical protein
MVGNLASLDTSLTHNDARVTFQEIYEIFNPETLDDSLLSQPQIRKLVESIFESLRTLSSATQASSSPSEASRLRGRLNYLRNRLAALRDLGPAPMIERITPEDIAKSKIEPATSLDERRAEAGFSKIKVGKMSARKCFV